MWGGCEDAFARKVADVLGFEILEHDEARSVFRSPRPSYTLDELEKMAVRERLMKETGDYDLGYPFRFEQIAPEVPEFSLDDFRDRPVDVGEIGEGHDAWKDQVRVTESVASVNFDGKGFSD